MDTLARAPGGQMRGAATKAMSDIVEERQQSRYAPFAAAPLRAAARRPAGFVARSSHTAPGIARRSRLASGPGGQQQSVQIISSQTLSVSTFLFFGFQLIEQGIEALEVGLPQLPATLQPSAGVRERLRFNPAQVRASHHAASHEPGSLQDPDML